MLTPRPFPVRPNWREPFTVTYAFDTEILLSENGKEQRRGWRDTPRKQIGFMTSAITLQRFRSLKGFMAKTQGQVVLVPDIPRATKSLGQSDIFSYDMHVYAPAPSWLKAGATVVLIADERVESRTVEAVSGTTITFEEMNSAAWPSDIRVAPGVQVRVPDEVHASFLTRGIAEGAWTFNAEPCTEFEAFDDEPEELWNGREVFIRSCNWVNAQDLGFMHTTQTVDYGFGKTATFLEIKYGSETRTADYLLTTYAEAESIIAFYRRVRGRLGEFYVPTDERDIEVTSTINTGATSITVPGTQLAEDYGESTVFKAISIKMRDGRRFYRKVENVTVVGGNSRVVLEIGFPYAVTPDTVDVISWMPLCRLAADELIVVWQTNSVATIRMNFTTLEDETPE